MLSQHTIQIMNRYNTIVGMDELNHIIAFDMYILDGFPNIIKNSPLLTNISRNISTILESRESNIPNLLKELIYDVHREICKKANINLFVDNLPKVGYMNGEIIDINPETVFDTLDTGSIQGVIQITPAFYAIICQPDVAKHIAGRIDSMLVGDNIIKAYAVCGSL